MSLKCAICNNNAANVVCHHCGKPLCDDKKCRFSVDNDDAFSTSVTAYHCRECQRNFHPETSARG